MKFKKVIFLALSFVFLCILITIVKANPIFFPTPNDIPKIINNIVLFFLLFFPATIVVEFIAFYLAFEKYIAMNKFDERDLLKIILIINSLTFPLAQIFGIFLRLIWLRFSTFYYTLFFDNFSYFGSILLIEIVVISLESILFIDKINDIFIKKDLNFRLSNIKTIGAVCIANTISMFLGLLLPLGLVF
ncbi:MAG: hypothetical protein JSV62_09180 [Promethearchaeota archaeon]|nr:MAG: hypothetical protein JSV62_09180 [Candidatus Lokiarchaeota archaeon]